MRESSGGAARTGSLRVYRSTATGTGTLQRRWVPYKMARKLSSDTTLSCRQLRMSTHLAQGRLAPQRPQDRFCTHAQPGVRLAHWGRAGDGTMRLPLYVAPSYTGRRPRHSIRGMQACMHGPPARNRACDDVSDHAYMKAAYSTVTCLRVDLHWRARRVHTRARTRV